MDKPEDGITLLVRLGLDKQKGAERRIILSFGVPDWIGLGFGVSGRYIVSYTQNPVSSKYNKGPVHIWCVVECTQHLFLIRRLNRIQDSSL